MSDKIVVKEDEMMTIQEFGNWKKAYINNEINFYQWELVKLIMERGTVTVTGLKWMLPSNAN